MEEYLLFKAISQGTSLFYLSCPLLTFAKVELILFLNKCDLLAKKLEAGTRMAKFVPGFKDHPNNLEAVTKCAYSVC
jgi:hypothetical protein